MPRGKENLKILNKDLTFNPAAASSPRRSASNRDVKELISIMRDNAMDRLNSEKRKAIEDLEICYKNCLESLEHILPLPFKSTKKSTTMLEFIEEKLAELPSATNNVFGDMGPPNTSQVIKKRNFKRSMSLETVRSGSPDRSTNRRRTRSRQPSMNAKGFMTPLPRGRHAIAVVTPGPNVRAPTSVLRQPLTGEIAISLDGSPLLVSTSQGSQLPQLSIPLADGRVFAVQPIGDLQDASLPELNHETRQKLKALHEFLGKNVLND